VQYVEVIPRLNKLDSFLRNKDGHSVIDLQYCILVACNPYLHLSGVTSTTKSQMNLSSGDILVWLGFRNFMILRANLDLNLSDRNYIQAEKWSHSEQSVNSWETTTASMQRVIRMSVPTSLAFLLC
jgi:hypothetical protein